MHRSVARVPRADPSPTAKASGRRNRTSVTDDAITSIRHMILTGDLAPGDRLPPEADLAAKLGLSRTSLREAVRALTVLGVIDTRQGDGSYITGLGPELLLGALGLAVDLQREDTIPDLIAVRRILEPAATALAATRVTTTRSASTSSSTGSSTMRSSGQRAIRCCRCCLTASRLRRSGCASGEGRPCPAYSNAPWRNTEPSPTHWRPATPTSPTQPQPSTLPALKPGSAP
jgi:biotin operon repressor